MASMLTWLRWGSASVALLDLLTLASLIVAYAWHCALKPNRVVSAPAVGHRIAGRLQRVQASER